MVRFSLVLASATLLVTAAAAQDPPAPSATDQVGRLANVDVPLQASRLAKRMDINRDGVISRAEFRRHNADRARWQALDRNGDGVLDDVEQAGGLRPGPRIMR